MRYAREGAANRWRLPYCTRSPKTTFPRYGEGTGRKARSQVAGGVPGRRITCGKLRRSCSLCMRPVRSLDQKGRTESKIQMTHDRWVHSSSMHSRSEVGFASFPLSRSRPLTPSPRERGLGVFSHSSTRFVHLLEGPYVRFQRYAQFFITPHALRTSTSSSRAMNCARFCAFMHDRFSSFQRTAGNVFAWRTSSNDQSGLPFLKDKRKRRCASGIRPTISAINSSRV